MSSVLLQKRILCFCYLYLSHCPTFSHPISTCGLWYPDTKTLEEAQINKMDLIGRKLKLKPGMKVLDIGCGFGGSAKYLATKFGVSVTAYNISVEQVAYARKVCQGLDVNIIMEDYRKASGQFDAIYSIGFFEPSDPRTFVVILRSLTAA